MDAELDDSPDEMFNLQRALSLSSWPITQALGPHSTFNSSELLTQHAAQYHPQTKAATAIMTQTYQHPARHCTQAQIGALLVDSSLWPAIPFGFSGCWCYNRTYDSCDVTISILWVDPMQHGPPKVSHSTAMGVLLMLGNADCAAGPPKGIAKLSTVSESGRMRSPPLVDKFRRAKENMLQNWQSQPTNGKLLSLERMFHEVCQLCALFDDQNVPIDVYQRRGGSDLERLGCMLFCSFSRSQ